MLLSSFSRGVSDKQHDASIDNAALKIKGASRIRDFTALQATIADSNQVVGKPSYDDKWVLPSVLLYSHLTISIT